MKVLFVLADLGTLILTVSLAANRDAVRSERIEESDGARGGVVIWILGWCPLAIFETSFNAHPDMVAIALLCGALWARQRRWMLLCAVLCGLAVGAKIFALLLVPFLLERRVRDWLAFGAMVCAAYLPFWLASGPAVVSGLRDFARSWEFNSSIYGVISGLWGREPAHEICGGTFAVVWMAVFVCWLRRPSESRTGTSPPGTLIFGTFFLLSATVNPWYCLWLAPFVALRPSLTGLAALGFVTLSYMTGLNLGNPALGNFEHPLWVRLVEYGGIGAVGAFEWSRHIFRLRPRSSP